MTEKTLTTENIRPALDALRGELAPWPVVAKKQDRLNTAQLNAANSGITSSLVAQIIANTAAIRALESAITGTGLRALVVATLPAVGTTGILYIVPVTTYDPDTDADVVNYSNEYIWIVAPDAPVTEGYYEQVGQTGIVINNGQLTITVNGTSVGTFTANQSGDTTAAITVPTNADYVDRTTDQTVAGVKTFSSTINGTASKAIADEDGTSIKTGYVNVAGNQTVSGQKTWSDNQFFTSGIYQKNNNYTLGNTVTGNQTVTYSFADSVNSASGYCRSVIFETSNTTSTELAARNKFKNGALDPTGSVVTAQFFVRLDSNGNKYIAWDGSVNNSVTPYTTNTYSLGSSSYQWSSVYAQTYYYNGTAWGLDKSNVWSAENTYTNTVLTLKQISLEEGELPASNQTRRYRFTDKNNADLGWIQHRVNTSGESYIELYTVNKFDNSQLSPQGTAVANSFAIGLKGDGTRFASIMSDLYPTATNTYNLGTSTNQWSSVYAQTYYYNGTAWGLDKANTWSSLNAFQKGIYLAGDRQAYVCPMWSGSSSGLALLTNSKAVFVGTYTDDASGRKVIDTTKGYIQLHTGTSGTDNIAIIEPTNTTNSQLGTSTNKWKTLNGVNPGALSLPDIAQYVDLTSSIPSASLDGSADINLSSYITSSGWLSIVVPDTNTDDFVFVQNGSSLNNRFFMSGSKGNGFISLMMPINSAGGVNAKIKASSVTFCKFYPCLGNV